MSQTVKLETKISTQDLAQWNVERAAYCLSVAAKAIPMTSNAVKDVLKLDAEYHAASAEALSLGRPTEFGWITDMTLAPSDTTLLLKNKKGDVGFGFRREMGSGYHYRKGWEYAFHTPAPVYGSGFNQSGQPEELAAFALYPKSAPEPVQVIEVEDVCESGC